MTTERDGRSRAARVDATLSEIEQAGGAARSGRYNAIAVLIADAALAGDLRALLAAQRGLRRLHAVQVAGAASASAHEQRGRVLSLLDLTSWTIRRLDPGVPASV